MNQKATATIGTLIIGAICFLAAFVIWNTADNVAFGAASSGQAGYATTSTIQVGPQEDKTLFSENRDCANRYITTVASHIMLSFHSTINPRGMIGHIQAASTSVSYPSEDFGCRAVTAYADASTTITLTEFSQ